MKRLFKRILRLFLIFTFTFIFISPSKKVSAETISGTNWTYDPETRILYTEPGFNYGNTAVPSTIYYNEIISFKSQVVKIVMRSGNHAVGNGNTYHFYQGFNSLKEI